MTIHHYGDGLSLVLGPPASVGHVPLDGSEPSIIFGVNFNNERVDVAGNHTMVDSVTYTAAKTWDGLRYAAELPGNSSSLIISDVQAANQIATAAAVSYGGMFLINAASSFDNATILHVGTSSGSTNQNYGMRWKKSNENYQRLPGAVDTTYAGGLEDWVHICVVEPANRATALWYINGVYQETTSPSSTGQPNATDKVRIGFSASANSDAAGWCSDVFICAAELTAGQVMTFATNAWGKAPPAAP